MAQQHLAPNEVIGAVRDEPPARRDPTIAAYARVQWTDAQEARAQTEIARHALDVAIAQLKKMRSRVVGAFVFGIATGLTVAIAVAHWVQ